MINLKELKPGNVALFESEKIIIKSIHSTPLRTDVMFRKQNVFRIWKECTTTNDKIEFISLSKNILMKINFSDFFDKLKENRFYWVDEFLTIVEHQGNFKVFGFGISVNSISNLHELQNLFYLLKKVELPIHTLWDIDVMTENT